MRSVIDWYKLKKLLNISMKYSDY